MKDGDFARELEAIAARFVYPPAPNLAARERDRLRQAMKPPRTRTAVYRSLAAGVVILLLLVAVLLAIPPARAALLRVLQIGMFEIDVVDEPAISTAILPASTPLSGSLTDLGDQTTLADAAKVFPFPLIMPDSLGTPDWVYVQHLTDHPSKIVTLVWSGDDGAPESQIMLTYFGLEGLARKTAGGEQVRDVRIADLPAVWVEGPHELSLRSLESTSELIVENNVLIWSDGVVTYRLEGVFELDEAIELAKSLR